MLQFLFGVLVGIWAHKLYADYRTRQWFKSFVEEAMSWKRDRDRGEQ